MQRSTCFPEDEEDPDAEDSVFNGFVKYLETYQPHHKVVQEFDQWLPTAEDSTDRSLSNRPPERMWFRKDGSYYSWFPTLPSDLLRLIDVMASQNGCTEITIFDGRHGGKWGTVLDQEGATADMLLDEDRDMIGESREIIDQFPKKQVGVTELTNVSSSATEDGQVTTFYVNVGEDEIMLPIKVSLYDSATWDLQQLKDMRDSLTKSEYQQSCSVIGWCFSFASFQAYAQSAVELSDQYVHDSRSYMDPDDPDNPDAIIDRIVEEL